MHRQSNGVSSPIPTSSRVLHNVLMVIKLARELIESAQELVPLLQPYSVSFMFTLPNSSTLCCFLRGSFIAKYSDNPLTISLTLLLCINFHHIVILQGVSSFVH